MTESRSLFGTDGIRGRANHPPLTAEMGVAFGRAVATQLAAPHHFGPRFPIVIGRDTRLSGPFLESAVASGIASMGVDVLLLGVVPTPAIATLTRHLHASAGIVISASHNPFQDNGLKIFQDSGLKCDDALEAEISQRMLSTDPSHFLPSDELIGRIEAWPDAAQRYVDLAVRSHGSDLDLSGFKVVVDAANGAASFTTPAVLRELGAEVIVLNAHPSGTNINDHCGSTHPAAMQAAVRQHHAHLGLAHDGDADRLICADESGSITDGDDILAVLGLDMLQKGKLNQNTLVATVMSNLGLEDCLAAFGGKVIRSAVGDRYVLEQMLAHGLNLGGEQSGHLILWDQNTTGDGLVTALEVLRVMKLSGLPLSRLRTLLHKYPQLLIDIPVRERIPLDQLTEVNQVLSAVGKELGSQGRVLLRYSGTELVLRLLVEVREKSKLQAVADRLLVPIHRVFN